MQVNWHTFLRLILWLLNLNYAVADRAVMINKITQMPCTKLDSSPALTTGEQVFSAASVQTTSVQEIMISIWFKPKAIQSFDNPIFSIYTNSPFTKLLSLHYENLSYTIYGVFKGFSSGQITIDPTIWNFVRLLAQLSPSAGGPDSQLVQHSMNGSENTSGIVTLGSPAGSIMTFDKSNLVFNFGYSASTIIDLPSCSIIDYVVVKFNFDSSEWTDILKFRESQQFDSNLSIHYDLFYSKQNINSLLSFGSLSNRVDQTGLSLDSNNQVILNYPNKITILLDQLESNGFIISFERRICDQNNFFQINNLLKLSISSGFVSISAFGIANPIQLRSVVLGEWIQFVIIVQKLANNQFAFKFYDGIGFPTIAILYYAVQKLNFISFQPDSTNNSLSLDNIRLFSGALITETASCLVQTEGSSQFFCIICQPGLFLSYEQNQTCLTSIPSGKTTSRVPKIIDWARTDCPLNKMHSPFNSQCQCPFQTYNLNGICTQCPTYCRGCHSATKCIEFDNYREISTGKCLDDMFDDGYNCIKRSFYIPQRLNYYELMLTHGRTDLVNSILSLSGTSSFFFTLNFMVSNTSTSNFPTIKVAHFLSSGVPILEVYAEEISPTFSNICFYYYSNVLQCFIVAKGSFSLISMWVGQTEAIVALNQKEIQQFNLVGLSPTFPPYVNPELCLGVCGIPDTNSDFLYFSSLKYFSGLTKPLDFKKDVYQLMLTKSALSFEFILSIENKVNQSLTLSSTDGTSSKTAILQVQDVVANQLKGLSKIFTFTMNSLSIYQISLSLFIQSLEGTYNLIEYDYQNDDNLRQSISLISHKSRLEMIIQVSIGYETILAKNCFIKFNEPTFLVFIWREQQKNIYEIEIVSNFCRETLTFHQQQIQSYSYLKIFSSGIPGNYLNNIRGYEGSEFYFDYTASDPCFLYYDLSNMKCMKAKNGSAVYKYNTILIENCPKIIGPTKYYYNRFTGECVVNPVQSECALIDEELLVCIKCPDPNADPSNSCKCKMGYYQNQNTLICEPCMAQCESCVSSLACLTCFSSDALAPTCGCIDSNSYLTSDFQCKACSPRCVGCETSSDNCLKCAADRIEIPKCNCNPANFDQILSTNLNCVEIECSPKCETCEYDSSQCTQCGLNRTKPPLCGCEENYIEVNNECITCGSHQYFDQTEQKCLECNFRCVECKTKATQCTECDPSLYLYNSKCVCSDFSDFLFNAEGEISCTQVMNVSLKAQVINDINCLVLTFEEAIDEINFGELEFDRLLFVYFSQISSKQFEIQSARIDENLVIFELKIFQTCPTLTGSVIILKPYIFTNLSKQLVLDPKYLIQSLSFKFSSITFQQDTFSSSQSLINTTEGIRNIVGENNSPTGILRQLSVIFYIINTIQPCAIFLLVDVPLPPNLYQYLQIIGLTIFSKVPDYGQNTSSEEETDFFMKLGLSGPSMLSMPAVFVQFGVWSSIYLFTLLTTYLLGAHHRDQYNCLYKIKEFVTMRLAACIEGSILLLIALSTLQIIHINEDYYYNRMSIYMAIYTFFVVGLIYFKVYMIQSNKKTIEQESLSCKFKKGQAPMHYINSQFCKKIVMALLSVMIVEFPQLVCYLFSFIILMSLIQTIIIRPYHRLLNNLIKILGELCQLIVWIIYAFVFAPLGYYVQSEQTTLSEDQTNQFLLSGYICIYCVLIFNTIFLIEFFYTLTTSTYYWCKNRTIFNKIPQSEETKILLQWKNQSFFREINFLNSSKLMATKPEKNKVKFKKPMGYQK